MESCVFLASGLLSLVSGGVDGESAVLSGGASSSASAVGSGDSVSVADGAGPVDFDVNFADGEAR
jgi:hypothetical protein